MLKLAVMRETADIPGADDAALPEGAAEVSHELWLPEGLLPPAGSSALAPKPTPASVASRLRALFDRGGVSGTGKNLGPTRIIPRRQLPNAATMLRSMTRHIAQQAVEIIYPSSCIACHAATGESNALCASCWQRMRFIEEPFCERLGTPFAQDLGAGLISPEAFARPPVFTRARAAVRFEDGPARELAHRLKYGDRPELARPMGRWMARAGAELLQDADLLVPVPLHFGRLFRRRFNQAALLADAISRHTGRPADPFALRRIKPTQPQVGLTRAQRTDNLQGAFKVPDEAKVRIAGKRLVLVDDVLTTGSTMNATARILLRAGAAQVDALVFARVVHDGN